MDSLHGELTPRSVTSDVGPLDFSFAPSEGPARPRSSRAASPFTLLGTSRADLATPSTPGSVADSDPGHMSPRFILGGRASLGQDSVSSVPRGGGGDLLLDGGLDEWEMVQGASSLYVFSGSRLRPARLQGRRMNTDQRAETLRQSAPKGKKRMLLIMETGALCQSHRGCAGTRAGGRCGEERGEIVRAELCRAGREWKA